MQHPAHEYLIELGFVHSHVPEEWEDVGDGETGPMICGHGAFDEYTNDQDNEVIYILPDGRVEREFVEDPPEWDGR